MDILSQGAEATLYVKAGKTVAVATLVKDRSSKPYRHAVLDHQLRLRRMRREVKALNDAASLIPVPKVLAVDEKNCLFEMQYFAVDALSSVLETLDWKALLFLAGKQLGTLHAHDLIHGDLTTSNMLFANDLLYFIDFGLSIVSRKDEDKAVDMHLFSRALESKHYAIAELGFERFLAGYKEGNAAGFAAVLERFEQVQERGRYKHKH